MPVINSFDLESMRAIKRDHVRLRAMLRDLQDQVRGYTGNAPAPVAYLAMPASGIGALDGEQTKTAALGRARIFRRNAADEVYYTGLDQAVANAWGEIPETHLLLLIRANTGEFWPIAPEVDKGILEENLTYRGSATVNLYSPDDSDAEAANGGELTAWSWCLGVSDVIAAGTEVIVSKIGRRWYVTAAACSAAALPPGGTPAGGGSLSYTPHPFFPNQFFPLE